MTSQLAGRELTWTNQRLVRECCKGNERAWSALIDKYKNLIFSIPIKFGLTRDDAADIFQAVCLDLLSSLPQLREPAALPKWIMQTTYHKCLRRKEHQLKFSQDSINFDETASTAELPEEMLHQLQREQSLRDGISSLPNRCRQMIQLLFFEDPPRPYNEVARTLGLSTGSIGFIRGRCIKRLRAELEKRGVP
jgi:RNA polymerase sigma factor (sigma-70 family)